jgi:DNA-binding CsgD family transcriptional regulator/tetratricopeptide (TPR) repeat protein
MAYSPRSVGAADGQLGAVRRPRFVGRQPQLAALAQALGDPPAVVLIDGEAGIGKSRLLAEYLTSEANLGRVLVARCPPFGQPQTLGPVTDVLSQVGREVPGIRLSALAGALRPLFPEWAGSLPPALPPAEDAGAARNRLFRALAELLAQLGVEALAVEDAHWADEVTLEFLLFLASREPQPLSLVVTWRPEELPGGSPLRRLSRQTAGVGSGSRISLGPLDVPAVAELTSSMLAGEQVSDQLADFLHHHTEGVPLAVEELVRLMADRADLVRSRGHWVRLPITEIAVPATITDAVVERVTRLSPQGQDVLHAAAVFAEPTAEGPLAAAAAMTADQVRDGVSEAIGRGLLSQDPRGLVSFRHVLVCRAVYETVPAPRRRALHSRAGAALENESPAPAARLARHFREAGETSRWHHYAERAADLALATSDDATAGAILQDLLADPDLPVSSIPRLAKKLPLDYSALPAPPHDMVAVLRSILDTRPMSASQKGEVRYQLGRLLSLMDEIEVGLREVEQAIPYLSHVPGDAAHAMMLLGWPRATARTARVHRQWLRRAAKVMAAPMAPADRTRLLIDRSSALLGLGENEGWAEAARIPSDTTSPQERREVTRGHINLAHLSIRWGRYRQAREHLELAFSLAERYEYLRLHQLALSTCAHLDWFTGDWAGLADRASSLTSDDSAHAARLEGTLVCGLLHAAAGARQQAEQSLHWVLTESQGRGLLDELTDAAAALARLALAAGRADDALQATAKAIDIVAYKQVWIWATDLAPARVDALVAAGRAGEAAALAGMFARGLTGRDAAAPKAGLAHCRAVMASARGEHARAAALFGRAAAAWQALPRPYDALLARERQAGCLLAAGRPDAGLAMLSEVMGELSRLGASADADRLARTLREQGVDVRRARKGRPSYGGKLSPRELEVVRLVAAGQTNQQIAETLFLSPKTVASHVDSARRKLSAPSRTALAVSALAAGFV